MTTIEISYQQQLAQKVQQLTQLMAEFTPPVPKIYASPETHYRMRAEFRIWHNGDELHHIMFDPNTRQRIYLEQFPPASQLINTVMSLLTQELKKVSVLRYKLFQIDYLSTLSNKIIVTLIYHKKLDDTWQQAAIQLRKQLQTEGIDLQLIGRAAKQKICLDHDYVDEVLTVNNRSIIYRQVENSFTQPNAAVNINMLEWATNVTQHAQGDLLELYCGNGNFSLALAGNFQRVLATEIAKPSVQAAQYNIAVNQLTNVQIIRMSAEEFTQAIQGVRQFNRLQGISLHDYQCNTILVDPPRSGLDSETINMVQQYPTIIYISCNPDTLKANLQVLNQTHKITEFALFDQFPFTKHIECGVVLKKR